MAKNKYDPIVSELDDIAQHLEKTGNADLASEVDVCVAELLESEPKASPTKKVAKPLSKMHRRVINASIHELRDISKELIEDGDLREARQVLKLSEELQEEYKDSKPASEILDHDDDKKDDDEDSDDDDDDDEDKKDDDDKDDDVDVGGSARMADDDVDVHVDDEDTDDEDDEDKDDDEASDSDSDDDDDKQVDASADKKNASYLRQRTAIVKRIANRLQGAGKARTARRVLNLLKQV